MQARSASVASLAARLALAAALAACAGPAAAKESRRAAEEAVRRGAASFEKLERADVDMLSRELDKLVADPALLGPYLARDREKLLAAAKPIFEALKTRDQITHFYFLDPPPARTCFLRVHKPEQFGDVVGRDTFSAAIATGKIGHGKELGKTAFALRVVKPIVKDGKVAGYMELGEEIDHFFDRMKQQTGDDFGLLVDKGHVDRQELARIRHDDRWDERPEVVLINSTMWDERHIAVPVPLAKLAAAGAMVPDWQEEGRTYAGGAFPVKDAAGHVVGALFVRHKVAGAAPEKGPAASTK